MNLVQRPDLERAVRTALARSPATALLGPRQCGKTTLARQIHAADGGEYLDLEDPTDRARLAHPKLALERLRGLVVIDEAQRLPDLFPLLRVLLDRQPPPARFLLLGSASPGLIRGVSESLAGRVERVLMSGLGLAEVGDEARQTLWLRGGFPRSFLAATPEDSRVWRRDFLETFAERDVARLGRKIAPDVIRRFFTMVGHYHGRVWNASDIASSLQVAHTTARGYLDLLSGAYLVRQLSPWLENVGKRVVKSPKVYVRDSGLLHTLLGIPDRRLLEGHPKLGASWEGFVLEELLGGADERHAHFWATHAGAELDLLLTLGGRRFGFEMKVTDAPRTSKSMRIALADLRLDHLYVVHPGSASFPLDEHITAVTLREAITIVRTHRAA